MATELDRVAAGVEARLDWAKGTDPIAQASRWVPERMYPWQVKSLRECSKPGARVAVVTPNESGKTSVVIPVLGLSWMAAFPGSQVVSTSGVERQIKHQLWPVLKATLRKFPQWQITDDLRVKAPGIRGLPGSQWEAFTTKDPQYAEGFHPRFYKDEDGNVRYAPLLIIVDEAKSFNDAEMMFAFQKRCDPDVLLMISTPGEDNGPFFDAFHKERGDPWSCIEVGWADCPHLRVGFKLQTRLDAIRKLGDENSLVMSWVYGKFYRRGGRFVFDDMESVQRSMKGGLSWVRGSRCAGIDFSGGGDEQVFGVRDGNKVFPMEVWHEKNDVVLCNMLIERFKRWKLSPNEIVADAGGAGKPCIDLLESKGWYGIQRYLFNGKAKDERAFRFISAEDHFSVRERLKQGGLILPDDLVLEDQMRKRKYRVLNDENRIQLEPKDEIRNRGEESPGRLDVLVMLCSDMEPLPLFDEGMRGKEWRGRCGSVEDCRRRAVESGEGATWATGMFMDE